MRDEQWLHMGQINGVYGVRGWVKVYSHTQPLNNILKYTPWVLEHRGERQSWQVIAGHLQGKGLVAHLAKEGGEPLSQREEAERLMGADIYIARSQLKPLRKGEHYWFDLEGLTVINQADEVLGTVQSLLDTGAHPVMTVQDGDVQHLIPYVKPEYIVDVDLDAAQIRVNWERDWS